MTELIPCKKLVHISYERRAFSIGLDVAWLRLLIKRRMYGYFHFCWYLYMCKTAHARIKI